MEGEIGSKTNEGKRVSVSEKERLCRKERNQHKVKVKDLPTLQNMSVRDGRFNARNIM